MEGLAMTWQMCGVEDLSVKWKTILTKMVWTIEIGKGGVLGEVRVQG